MALKHTKLKYLLIILLFAYCTINFTCLASAQNAHIVNISNSSLSDSITQKKKILILNSYHHGFHWTDRIMQGIEETLKDHTNIELHAIYMDSKRHTDSVYLNQLASLYQYKYSQIKFDIVISSDDNGLDFLLKYRDTVFPNTPIVFCGINDFQPDRIKGHKNITGIYESYDVKGTIDLITQTHTKTKKVFVISDITPSGKAFLNRINRVKSFYNNNLDIIKYTNFSIEELKDSLMHIPENSAILWSIYLKDKNNKTLTVNESIQLISNNTQAPIYCVWDVVGKGVLGGKITSPKYQGNKSAKLALEILNGANPDSIRIKGSPMIYKFDYNILKKYNINKSSLPANNIIVNEPHSLLHRYKNTIIIVIFLIIVLSLTVITQVYLIRKRKQAEKKLKKLLITHKKSAQKLRETNALLNIEKKKAKKSNQLKTAFLANLSHEIRTPMNGIMGFASLLKEENLDRSLTKDYLTIIESSSERMLAMINKIIDISKIETGVIQLNTSVADLKKLTHQLHTFFIPEINKKGLEFYCENEFDKNTCLIETDVLKLEQILYNLISNAIKFTQKGKVEFGYKCSPYHVDFWVKDSGIGIHNKRKDLIFERFSTLENRNYTDNDGIGLGLAISKSYIELMQGEIWMESSPGKGSSFYFKLPKKINSPIKN